MKNGISKTIDVLNDNEEVIFSIVVNNEKVEIFAPTVLVYNGRCLDNKLSINPQAANLVVIKRKEYEKT